jgi:hypothetical protein
LGEVWQQKGVAEGELLEKSRGTGNGISGKGKVVFGRELFWRGVSWGWLGVF